MNQSVSLIIPTLNGGELFEQCLKSISVQSLKIDKKLIIDSSSSDNTVKLAKEYGFDVIMINKQNFDHGGTRNQALQSIDTDLVIYMTQDAILKDEIALESIKSTFSYENVEAVYGRQLPHDDANPLATFARQYSYSEHSYITSLDDDAVLGFKKAFMSNSFACYRVKALNEIGGFPRELILGEDSYVAAKLLMAGKKVGYNALAMVKHSHNYSFSEEFKRYFDTGVFHSTESWMRDELGTVEGQGVKFALSQIILLLKKSKYSWAIKSLVSSGAKYSGYKLGLRHKKLPNFICVNFSMFKGYFLK